MNLTNVTNVTSNITSLNYDLINAFTIISYLIIGFISLALCLICLSWYILNIRIILRILYSCLICSCCDIVESKKDENVYITSLPVNKVMDIV